MSRSVTLGTLVDRCQKRADLENQTTISDADWKEMIHLVYGELYGELTKPGVGYFDSTQTILTTGAAVYALPSDHLHTLGVDEILDAAGHRRQLEEMAIQERHIFAGRTGAAIGYRFSATNLVLHPTPPSGKTYEHIYVPQPADLASASDSASVEMATADGEAFLVWGVVAMALHRLEMDPRFANSKHESARERVIEDATLRSLNSTRRRFVKDDPEWSDYDPADFRWNPPT